MTKLLGADRKATATQVTTHFNQSMQKSFSECATLRIVKQKTAPGDTPAS